MTELIFVVEEDPEGGYTARAQGQSIFTEADTLDELRTNIREAVQCHFEEGEAPNFVMQYRDDVRQAILTGLADSNAGRTVSVGEVRSRFGLPQ